LAQERTEDILLNPDSALWVKRRGEGFVRVGEMPATQAMSALSTIAAWRGTVLNHSNPILETELPIDGSRFEGIVPPVVRQPVFAIRLRPKTVFTLEDYETGGILTRRDDPANARRQRQDFVAAVRGRSHAEVIRAAVLARKHPRRGQHGQRQNDARQRAAARAVHPGSRSSVNCEPQNQVNYESCAGRHQGREADERTGKTIHPATA
jgi:hypothetical protein